MNTTTPFLTTRQQAWASTRRSVGTLFPFASCQLAPARYVGFQPGFGSLPGFKLFNLTRPVGDLPEGTTVSEATLRKLGFRLPA